MPFQRPTKVSVLPALLFTFAMSVGVCAQETSEQWGEVGWGLQAGHGESGTILGANFQLAHELGDGPSLLTVDLSNLFTMFRDDRNFVSISALPTYVGLIIAGASGGHSESPLTEPLVLAFLIPEAISNMGIGFENERRQRVVLGLDSLAYSWANRDTEDAYGGAFFLGMQLRPHLGVTLPMRGKKTAFFASGGYNYDWSWQSRSEALGWDFQAGIALRTDGVRW